MSITRFQNLNTLGNYSLYLGNTADLTISNSSANLLTAKTNVTDGGINLQSGTAGINLDSTMGGSTTTGTVSGSISLKSGSASSWINDNSNLTLQTTTSGNIAMNSVGSFNVAASSQSVWTQNGSNLVLQTISSGNLNLISAGSTFLTSNGASSWTTTSSSLSLNVNNPGATTLGSIAISNTGSYTLTSLVNSTIETTGVGDLTLGSTGTGSTYLSSGAALTISATGNMSADSLGSLTIGATSTGINIGAVGKTVTILGNLVVDGTTDTHSIVQSEELTLEQKAVQVDGVITAGALRSSGGLGTSMNILAYANGGDISVPILSVTQSSSTGAQPVVFMEQVDNSQSLFSFSASSNGSSTSTTIVPISASPSGTLAGYVKIYVQDNSSESGYLTTGNYYMPIFSIPAIPV